MYAITEQHRVNQRGPSRGAMLPDRRRACKLRQADGRHTVSETSTEAINQFV
jgi:hypothetical protein